MLHLPLADKILFAIIFVTMETDLSLVISAQFLFFFLGRGGAMVTTMTTIWKPPGN